MHLVTRVKAANRVLADAAPAPASTPYMGPSHPDEPTCTTDCLDIDGDMYSLMAERGATEEPSDASIELMHTELNCRCHCHAPAEEPQTPLPPTTVHHIKEFGGLAGVMRDPDAVFIGRPSRWGNPFRIGEDGCRDDVVQMYHDNMSEQDKLDCQFLLGKKLVCYCAPSLCHGNVLAEIAESFREPATTSKYDPFLAWREADEHAMEMLETIIQRIRAKDPAFGRMTNKGREQLINDLGDVITASPV